MVIHKIKIRDLPKIFNASSSNIDFPKSMQVKDGSLTSLKEFEALVSLCKLSNPKNIFEIGTFEGYSTYTLVKNSEDSIIYTLDLPNKNIILKYNVGDLNQKYISQNKQIIFLNKIEKSRIKQLYGDSAVFDFKKFYDKMDFIFIDGSHTYEYTKNDTEKAFKMIRKNGVVVWHDYNPKYWKGTVKYLDELALTKNLYHIEDTYLVFYKIQDTNEVLKINKELKKNQKGGQK
ncbi:MAG: class I SAM-dependent methyltransferase [Candidatus Nanoarchaeia archaeon]|nr:class I SAM-dependent methyltransferase [Candidatus Nanoarchaeia archaeon]